MPINGNRLTTFIVVCIFIMLSCIIGITSAALPVQMSRDWREWQQERQRQNEGEVGREGLAPPKWARGKSPRQYYKTKGKKRMPNATDAMNKKGTAGNLLHGSDLHKAKLDYIDVKVADVREPGNSQFNSPLVMDFDGEVLGAAGIGLNKTNIKQLVKATGSENTDDWKGIKVRFSKVITNNPQSKSMAHGLLITRVNGKEIKG